MVTSWQEGFDKVNEMYGTEIKVKINPVLEHVVEQPSENSPNPSETDSAAVVEENENGETEEVATEATETEATETAEEVVEEAMDKTEGGESNGNESEDD